MISKQFVDPLRKWHVDIFKNTGYFLLVSSFNIVYFWYLL